MCSVCGHSSAQPFVRPLFCKEVSKGANNAKEGAMGDGPKGNHRSKTFKLHNTTWQAPFSIILGPLK